MNWDCFEGNLKQITGKIKEHWGRLTDDQLAEGAGRRDQLVGRIQEVYGLNRDEAEKQLKDWESLQ